MTEQDNMNALTFIYLEQIHADLMTKFLNLLKYVMAAFEA